MRETDHHTTVNHWKERLRASSIHFVVSLGIAALAALLVFMLWYPYPYREISGGRELFFIVVTVDVILGPLLTFTIYNRAKPVSELRRDLAIVVLLQLAGLAYGMWTVLAARPVHLAFEIDRFRVIHAVDVPEELMAAAPPSVKAMPWWGPTTVSVRSFKDEKENFEATMTALRGIPLGARPDLWQPFEMALPQVLQAGKPIAALKARFPARAQEIDRAIASTGLSGDDLLYLPLVGRKSFWTVLVDRNNARPLAYIPLDPY